MDDFAKARRYAVIFGNIGSQSSFSLHFALTFLTLFLKCKRTCVQVWRQSPDFEVLTVFAARDNDGARRI